MTLYAGRRPRSRVELSRRPQVGCTLVPELVRPDCDSATAEECNVRAHLQAKLVPSGRDEVPAMFGRVEPHSHDLMGRCILAPAPGEVLANGISTGAESISHIREPRHECPAARCVRKLITRKISIDLEPCNTIELR